MKIGLAWLNQIRSDVNVGGFTAETFDSLLAQLEAAYHTQHTVSDGHATITASGTISERGRTTPLGEWIAQPFAATLFTASSGSTWSVLASGYTVYSYTLVGQTMTISFQITNSVLSGAAAARLKIALPEHAMVSRRAIAACAYVDNGTAGTGVVMADPGTGNYLVITKDLSAAGTFSVSGALTVAGQISLEVADTV